MNKHSLLNLISLSNADLLTSCKKILRKQLFQFFLWKDHEMQINWYWLLYNMRYFFKGER